MVSSILSIESIQLKIDSQQSKNKLGHIKVYPRVYFHEALQV